MYNSTHVWAFESNNNLSSMWYIFPNKIHQLMLGTISIFANGTLIGKSFFPIFLFFFSSIFLTHKIRTLMNVRNFIFMVNIFISNIFRHKSAFYIYLRLVFVLSYVANGKHNYEKKTNSCMPFRMHKNRSFLIWSQMEYMKPSKE